MSKICLFNHCQKHNLNAGRRVSSYAPLSDGQNRLEESKDDAGSPIHIALRFPSFPPSSHPSYLSLSASRCPSSRTRSRPTGFAGPQMRCCVVRNTESSGFDPGKKKERGSKKKKAYAKYRISDRATFFLDTTVTRRFLHSSTGSFV